MLASNPMLYWNKPFSLTEIVCPLVFLRVQVPRPNSVIVQVPRVIEFFILSCMYIVTKKS